MSIQSKSSCHIKAKVQHVDVIWDKYLENSLKSQARNKALGGEGMDPPKIAMWLSDVWQQ
jgi:hypothetical protein